MMTDKYIEKLLDLYFKGELSQEEKEKLFESLRSNPSLNDTVQYVLSHVDPSKAESFLAEKSLMCDTEIISESDETLIELYLSGLMSQEEEDDFLKKLVADTDLRTNALAQAFLIKAIRKIQNEDNRVLEAAKNTSVSDINSLFEELQTEDDDMLIDSYLQGNMSESEIKAFQERLNSDKEFKERVAAITILAKGIQIQQEQDNKIIKDAKSLSKEEEDEIVKIINSVPGVFEPHHLKTRRLGNRISIEAHIRMDGKTVLEEAHDRATDIENRLKEKFGKDAHVTLHMEPTKGEKA